MEKTKQAAIGVAFVLGGVGMVENAGPTTSPMWIFLVFTGVVMALGGAAQIVGAWKPEKKG